MNVRDGQSERNAQAGSDSAKEENPTEGSSAASVAEPPQPVERLTMAVEVAVADQSAVLQLAEGSSASSTSSGVESDQLALRLAESSSVSSGVESDWPVEWLTATDAVATRVAGLRFAERLAPGDLVILSGELGAGKTTFTQGLAEGLGVRGPITSPTFVLARVHPSLVGGPSLVHVDAYRLGSLAELDDLDLDASFDESVTVVEWGEGKAEVLAEGRSGHYLVRLDRSREDDVREIVISRA